MICKRRSGFTLIELLVVIAIIAILAAMLFPVFARARESARKIQCLSNVKNISIAVQMYLTDYDRMPPSEHATDSEVYFRTEPGKGGSGDHEDCNHKTHANPYLRWPVILDEYVKNRDVWRCPSAKLEKGVTVVITAQPTWLKYWLDHEGLWGRVSDCDGGGPCGVAWPTGWGGTITDSIVQGQCSGPDTNHFAQSVGTSDAENLKTSQIEDASWYVVCGDTGGQVELWSPLNIAYVEACGANACGTCCGTSPAVGGCCAGDWANCSWSADCGYLDAPVKTKFWTDASIRKQYTRHLGGSNIGFADGHASWMMADALVAAGPTSWDPNRGKIRGIGCSCVPDRMM